MPSAGDALDPFDTNRTPELSEPVAVAVGSVVRFGLQAIPDPSRPLFANDDVEFTGTPTASSSDRAIFKVVRVDAVSLQIEVLTAGTGTLNLSWDEAVGSRTIDAVEPTQYNVGFDDLQLADAPAGICTPASNGRSVPSAHRILAGEELIFTMQARGRRGDIYGQPRVPIEVTEVDAESTVATEFSDTVSINEDGSYVYEVPEVAAGEVLRFANGVGLGGAVRYFSIIPSAERLKIHTDATDRCEVDDAGAVVCPYTDLKRVRTMQYPLFVTGTVDGECIRRTSRCDVALELNVFTESDDDSDVATISSSCLEDGISTCTPESPCDVVVDGTFVVSFENGAAVSAIATYAGVSRELRFEPVPAE